MRVLCFVLLLLLLSVQGMTANKSSNFYSLLGVNKDADETSIKKAYRRLAMQHHPDKGGDAEKFKQINEAYETLADKKKREMYDLYGTSDPHAAQRNPFRAGPARGGGGESFFFNFDGSSGGQGQPGGGQGFNFGDVNDIINEMLGRKFGGGGGGGGGGGFFGMDGGGRGSSRKRGKGGWFGDEQSRGHGDANMQAPIEQPFTCTLEDLYSGCQKKFRVKDHITGGGDGDGRRYPIENIYVVAVKPGWKSGTKVSYKPLRHFPKTVTFVVREAKHAAFERKGDDLYLKHPVRITRAQLASLNDHHVAGDDAKAAEPKPRQKLSVHFLLLDGTKHTLFVDATVKDGQTRVLPGLGMVRKGTANSRGNLYIKFSVEGAPKQ